MRTVMREESQEAFSARRIILEYGRIKLNRYTLSIKDDQRRMRQNFTISRPVEYGLRFFGLWPDLPHAGLNCVLYILSLLVAQYFLYSYAAMHFEVRQISQLIDCLSFALVYTVVTLKLINLFYNRRIFHELLNSIDEDWSQASSVAINMTMMLQKAELSRRCMNGLMSFNAVTATFYVIGGYAIQSVKSGNNTREFPVRMEFPFDISATPIFEVALIIQFLHQLTVATLIAMFNGLVVTLILHISGQIDIICENVRGLTPKSFNSLGTIRKLVYQHQKIVHFSNNLNGVFSIIALLEFLWNTMVICFIGFAIVASLDTDDALTMMTKCITFYMSITMEAFVFCYGGEYLSEKSKSIGDAVYEMHWYNLKPHVCQALLFIIMRSQKRLTLTAGNLMDLSLEAFTSIMKASASYVSVLHAVY